jgi:hypothetical protein
MKPPQKLDLMNHRFFYKNENHRIYDSCEDITPSAEIQPRGSLQFSRRPGREIYKPPDIYHSNEIVNAPAKNHRGEFVTCIDTTLHSPLKSIVTERLSNTFELSNNDAALIFHNATRFNKSTKEAIGTGSNEVDSQLWKNIKAGNIHGGDWSACTTDRKPLMEIPTPLGPGDYDVTRWERYRGTLASHPVSDHLQESVWFDASRREVRRRRHRPLGSETCP